MTSSPERRSPLGIEFILPVVGFVVVAPVGALALPVAALTGRLATRVREAAFLSVLAALFAGWWLFGVGTPPEQILRAAMAVATFAYVLLTPILRTTVTHRSLIATWIATMVVVMLMIATRRDWAEIQWWIAGETGTARMLVLGAGAVLTRVTPLGPGSVAGLEGWADQLPDLAGTFFPGLVALQVMGGLVLATFFVHRIGLPVGGTPGRFREFSFSVHLGWIAGIAAILAAWGPDGPIWIVAVNVALVATVLFGLRGAAVVRAFWPFRGSRSWLAGLVALLLALVMWRVVATGLIVGGVVDTGLDIRNRWLKKG